MYAPADLADTARAVLDRAARAGLANFNESNAKALLIEPMLSALGWDVLDLDAVRREYAVRDGTFLDYALYVDGRPALFCEAKPPKRNLDDPRWVAQTINYGNGEGVAWCVLTDGLTWRVFKSNADGPLERKLAFEVCVADLVDEARAEHATWLFSHLTPAMVADGELTRLGTMVFVDGRVRETLRALLSEPHRSLVKLIRTNAGTDLTPADVRGALSRVVGNLTEALTAPPGGTGGTSETAAPPATGARHDGAGVRAPVRTQRRPRGVSCADLVASGLLAPGTVLAPTRRAYAAERAFVNADGALTFRGADYDTPSAAGRALLGGEGPNGWTFWKVVDDPAGTTLADLRARLTANT